MKTYGRQSSDRDTSHRYIIVPITTTIRTVRSHNVKNQSYNEDIRSDNTHVKTKAVEGVKIDMLCHSV